MQIVCDICFRVQNRLNASASAAHDDSQSGTCLLYTSEYRKELCREYQAQRKKYGIVAIPCCILFVAGIVALAATVRGYLPWSELHAFVFLGLGAGLLGFVYTAGMLDAYEQLVENEKYTRRLLFKLRKKVRTKIEQM